ncbi:hypothetical protein OH687_19615 [Burkholderia anthina]|nr:hypothetical protein OH687_19615 [Burkholderia anthina]
MDAARKPNPRDVDASCRSLAEAAAMGRSIPRDGGRLQADNYV